MKAFPSLIFTAHERQLSVQCRLYSIFCGRKTRILTCCSFSLLRKEFTIIGALLNTLSEGTFGAGVKRYFL